MKINKTKLIILLFINVFLSTNCNRGPAEDRGKRECKDAKLQTFLALDNYAKNPPSTANDPIAPGRTDTLLLLSAAGIEFACDKYNRDENLFRYYRGYIDGKE